MQYITSLGSTAILLCTIWIAPLYAQEHATPIERIPPKDLSGEEAQSVKLYQKVSETVVTIFSLQPVFTAEGLEKQESMGSGVLISSEGHVLTAAHLVEGAEKIRVKTHDGKLRPAELVYTEFSADIALIRIREAMPITSPFELKTGPPLLPELMAASVWMNSARIVPS